MAGPNYIFLEKEKLAFQVVGIAVVLTFVGVNLIVVSPMVWWRVAIGILLILAAVVAVTLRSKTYFNPEKQLLITETRSFYYHNTKQEKLPPAQYLSVIPVRISQRSNFLSISFTNQDMKCNLNLVFRQGSHPRYKTLRCMKKSEAIMLAQAIANRSGLRVLDCSSGKQQWIDDPVPART